MIRVNLFTDRKAKSRYLVEQQIVVGIIALVATVVLCGYVFLDMRAQKIDFQNRIAEIEQKIGQQNVVIAQVEKFEKIQKRLEGILKAISDLEKIQIGPTPYLDMANMILPDDLWLRNIIERSSKITLKGFAFSNPGISQFAERLKRSKLFYKVDIEESQQRVIQGEKVHEFSIVCNMKILKREELRKESVKTLRGVAEMEETLPADVPVEGKEL